MATPPLDLIGSGTGVSPKAYAMDPDQANAIWAQKLAQMYGVTPQGAMAVDPTVEAAARTQAQSTIDAANESPQTKLAHQYAEQLNNAQAKNDTDAQYGGQEAARTLQRKQADILGTGQASDEAYGAGTHQAMLDDQAARAAAALAPKYAAEEAKTEVPLLVQGEKNTGAAAVAQARAAASTEAGQYRALGAATGHASEPVANNVVSALQAAVNARTGGGIGDYSPADERVIAGLQGTIGDGKVLGTRADVVGYLKAHPEKYTLHPTGGQ